MMGAQLVVGAIVGLMRSVRCRSGCRVAHGGDASKIITTKSNTGQTS